jgi:methionyl-tRNA formyltransferase
MGSDAFSVPILEALLQRGAQLSSPVQVAGCVTQPDRPAGRGRRLAPGPVKRLAESAGVPVLQPERIRGSEAVEHVLRLRPDVIVVASFGQILPRRLLDVPRRHAINLHPSLLPRFRGASPIAGALLAGDDRTGTTLMRMSPRMDAGPILGQQEAGIGPDETRGELEARLAILSAELLLKCLPAWMEGALPERTQDESRATYTTTINKDDARIQWDLPAEEICRRVRAFNPSPVAWTTWNGVVMRIFRCDVLEGSAAPGGVVGLRDEVLEVGTGLGLLGVRELQLAGGRPVTARAFVAGHRDLLGAALGE